MTDEEIKAARELCKVATPGPWSFDRPIQGLPSNYLRFIVADCIGWNVYPATNEITHGTRAEDDARFIAASRKLVPELLDEVARLKERISHLESLATSKP